jgi:hypothetical protein
MLPRGTDAGPTRHPRGTDADDVIRPSSFVPIIPRVSGVSGAHGPHRCSGPGHTPIPVVSAQREGLASCRLAFGIWFQFGSNAGLQTGIQRDAASSLLLGFVGG